MLRRVGATARLPDGDRQVLKAAEHPNAGVVELLEVLRRGIEVVDRGGVEGGLGGRMHDLVRFDERGVVNSYSYNTSEIE